MIAVVSGSGLDLRPILDAVESEHTFADAIGLQHRNLSGHERTFVRGTVNGRDVLLQSGRFHLYEGLSVAEVVRPVDYIAATGADTIVFTNVSGGLRADLRPGHIVAVSELRTWPYQCWRSRPDRLVSDLIIDGCDCDGQYFWMHGPSYETPAEIRALRRLGCDVVGMSTAPEVQRAQQLGICCAVISVVTNACGDPQPLTHEEVVRVAHTASARLCDVLRAWLTTRPR